MKYYRLMAPEDEVPNDIVCYSEEGFETKYGVEDRTLCRGNEIDNWDKTFTFIFDPKEGDFFTDFLINDLQWVFVSEKVKSILQEVGSRNVQFLPVLIKNSQTGLIIDTYTVINVKQLDDALDLLNSDYMKLKTSGLIIVKKYALLSEKIVGKNIVRLQVQPNPLFLSEEAVNALLKHNVTGCSFYEVMTT